MTSEETPDSDRVTLITGASTGLGAAFAKRLAQQGRHLFLTARRADLLREQALQLEAEHGIRVRHFACDLTSENGLQMVEELLEIPNVEMIINNAGYGIAEPIHHLQKVHVTGQIALNVTAVARLSHAAAQSFSKRGGGRILNIASLASFAPVPGFSVYGATKSFVKDLSLAIADELESSGIQVGVVCPGFTRTSFLEKSGLGGFIERHAMDADTVVNLSLERFARGERLIIPGMTNAMLAHLGTHIPRRLQTQITRTFFHFQKNRK